MTGSESVMFWNLGKQEYIWWEIPYPPNSFILKKKKKFLNLFVVVWVWIGRVQIAKDTFTLISTQDSNGLELACHKSD